jgi:Flp pilus assembly protein TadD
MPAESVPRTVRTDETTGRSTAIAAPEDRPVADAREDAEPPSQPAAEPAPQAALATKPPPRPEPPLELVRLKVEPSISPGGSVSAAPLKEPSAVPADTEPPAASTNSTRLVILPVPKKKSFFQKISPLNLFKGKESSEPSEEPARVESPETDGAGATAQAAGLPAPQASPPRSFPRYNYSSPRAGPAGDSAAARNHFAQGAAAQRNGRLAEAMAAYQRAITADPACFEAYYNLGVAAQERGDWPTALEAYEGALALEESNTRARYNFALALQSAGYALDAAAEFEKIIAGNPGFADAHLSLAGLCAQTLDEPERARTHYRRMLELEPQHSRANEVRRWLAANRE